MGFITKIQTLWTPPKWPKRLVIVRHGQSEQNVALDAMELTKSQLELLVDSLRQTRDADIALTPIGMWQAEKTGKYLADTEPFDICLVSPYKRTLQTAGQIVAQFPYAVRTFKDDRLREKEFGMLHGLTKEEIRTLHPREHFARQRDGKYWYSLPGGENYPAVGMRVHGVGDKLSRDWAGNNVLIVTHHVPCVMFRAMYEHLDEAQVLALGDVPNCGISEYRLDRSKVPEGRLGLVQWNKVAYDMNQAPKPVFG